MTAPAAAPIIGKTVVVVGGSRGIGLEWVTRLLQQGNTVVATARDPAASTKLQQLLAGGGAGGKLTTMALDAASADSIAAWAEALKGAVSHVDVLIYNAGVLHEGVLDKLADVTAARLQDTFATNTFGPLLLTQALVKQGLLGGDAPSLCVYTTSSVGSVSSLPHAAQMPLYAYRASKAALNVLVRTLGAELQPLKVSTVLMHPGYVATDMTHGGAVAPGAISTEESVAAMLAILQDGREVDGKYFEYTGAEMAW